MPKSEHGAHGTVLYPFVIGIDQSLTETGIVVHSVRGDGYEHHLLRSSFRGAARLLDLKRQLSEVLQPLGVPTHIVMEGYSFGAQSKREALGELGGVFKTLLLEHYGSTHSVSYPTIVPPTKLKKFVTGAGNAKKDQMLLGTYKKWQQEFSNHNLSDAYGLARIGVALATGDTGTTYEALVISSLGVHTEWQPPAKSPTKSSSPATPRKRNSGSPPPPAPQQSRQPSAMPSTTAARSPSEPSEPGPSTKRLRRVPLLGAT